MNRSILYLFCVTLFGLFTHVMSTDRPNSQLIVVAPVDNPQVAYFCNTVKYKYFGKYATDCTVKRSFRFNDSKYIIGYMPREEYKNADNN